MDFEICTIGCDSFSCVSKCRDELAHSLETCPCSQKDQFGSENEVFQREDWQNLMNAFRDDLKSEKENREAAERELDECVRNWNSSNFELYQLKKSLFEQNANLSTLIEKNDALRKEEERLKTRSYRLWQKLDNQTSFLQDCQDGYSLATTENRALEEEIDAIKANLTDLQEKYQVVKSEEERLKTRSYRLWKKLDEQTDDLAKLEVIREVYVNLTSENEHLTELNENLTEINNDLQKNLSLQLSEIDLFRLENKNLTEQNEELAQNVSIIEALKNETELLRAEVEKVKENLKKVRAEKDAQKCEVLERSSKPQVLSMSSREGNGHYLDYWDYRSNMSYQQKDKVLELISLGVKKVNMKFMNSDHWEIANHGWKMNFHRGGFGRRKTFYFFLEKSYGSTPSFYCVAQHINDDNKVFKTDRVHSWAEDGKQFISFKKDSRWDKSDIRLNLTL
ncbi:Oidioi.mRNA.OKI2018_I69.chr2.g5366.t1.cds [Oikopleura dioica]|uniref:Oidioi.mRNA.OKI2018_I69.chr2.g5366.t1.cds n=1 Tax=Oikopleura dioica TaxID=34765 RepID=A0ABN7SZP4_OIKDI|nr:Oidioi.mRNA.OKI2018_I69.chr2.g5366.t1.cds [Oikopleura dioica]